MKTIGERIRQRRDEKEWSLPRLAEEAGVAKGYLWQLESGRADRPSASTLFKVAAALGTTVADLMGEKVAPSAGLRIPKSLREFAKNEGLTEEDVQMLAGIHYRGKRPKDEEDWRYLLQSIRRSVRQRVTHSLKHARERRTWNSLEALGLSKSTGIEDPVHAMRSLVEDLIAKGELKCPPTDLRLLASIQDVGSIEVASMKEAGRLVPKDGSLLIQVNADDPEVRRNFTVAHEISHTLLPTYSRKPVFRVDQAVGVFNRNDEEEYLCDIGASALMFPDTWFRPRARALGTSLQSVMTLATEFAGSLEATALAWTQMELGANAVVFWERTLKPKELRLLKQSRLPGFEEERPIPKFRVAKSFRSSRFPYFIPRHKSVAEDSVVAQACPGGFATGQVDVELDRAVLQLRCEAQYVPYKRNGIEVPRVMTLLQPIR